MDALCQVIGHLVSNLVENKGNLLTVVLKMKDETYGCIRPYIIGHSGLKMKLKGIYCLGGLFNITRLYSCSQPPTGWPGQHLHS